MDKTLERIIKLIEKDYTSYFAFENDFGIRNKTVDNWKRGRSKSYYKIIRELADFFDVTPNYLLDPTSTERVLPPTDEEIKFALFNGSEGVTDEMYEEVKAFAEFVKKREQQKGKK